MYRAFVDNYKVAVGTADKCCQANAGFAEISEVCKHATRGRPALDVAQLPPETSDDGAAFRGPRSDCFDRAVGGQ